MSSLPPDQGDKGGKGDQDGDSRRRDLEEKRDMNKGEEKRRSMTSRMMDLLVVML